MNRITKSREFLETDLRIVEKDNKFYQQTTRCGLKEIKPYIMTAKHKYGKATSYEYVLIYNYKTHNQTMLSYHSFLYAWYKGEVPAGMDVDHIDGDSLNNHIDNLQLLTRKENIAKRGAARNQYNYWMTDEEIYDARQKRAEENQQKANLRDEKRKNREDIKKQREEWHKIVSDINELREQRRAIKGVDIEEWRRIGIKIKELEKVKDSLV